MFGLHNWLKLFAVGAICGFLLTSCGGSGEDTEVVYLQVFNAYPGASSVSVYGPTGPVVTNLPFGERTDQPVPIDRNFGTDFQVLFEGAPQMQPIPVDLFTLYPGETATLMVSRRTGSGADARMYRHIQATSPNCRMVFDNSLSLQSDQIGVYNYIVGWHRPNIDMAVSTAGGESLPLGYDKAFEDDKLEELEMTEHQRPQQLFSTIESHPYFAMVPIQLQNEDEESDSVANRSFVWLGTDNTIDLPRVDFSSGSFVAPPTSREFVDCIEQAAEAEEQQEQGGGGGFPGGGGQEEQTKAEDCGNDKSYSANTVQAGAPQGHIVHYSPEVMGNSAGVCDVQFRLFTDFGNVFEGEHGHDSSVNQRIDREAVFESSDHFFFSIYGYPRDPRLETWVASKIDPDAESAGSGGGFYNDNEYPD